MQLENQFFSITTQRRSNEVAMVLRVHTDHYDTSSFPEIIPFLMQHAPDALETHCFNPGNLSFPEEVRHTEIGHLFEHILIAFLCEEADKAQLSGVVYDATTAWDWELHPAGSFSIKIYGDVPADHLAAAIKRSTNVLEKLFQTQQQPQTWLPSAQSDETSLESLLGTAHT